MLDQVWKNTWLGFFFPIIILYLAMQVAHSNINFLYVSEPLVLCEYKKANLHLLVGQDTYMKSI